MRGGEAEPEWYLGVGVKVHIVVQEHSLVKSGYVREPITRKSGYVLVVDRLVKSSTNRSRIFLKISHLTRYKSQVFFD